MSTPDPESQALLQRLERSPGLVLRVIVTLKPGDAALQAALRALHDAGVADVQRIEGRPLLVADLHAAPLRALLGTGQVLRVQPDAATPAH